MEVRFATAGDGVDDATVARRTAFVVAEPHGRQWVVQTHFCHPTHVEISSPDDQAYSLELLSALATEIQWWSPQVEMIT